MSNNLIIVESYTKTKTIYKYLKDENHKYNVTFSQGHFCDLPKNELGININTWEGTYTTTKENILKNIRKYVKEADNIYIAADPDTEGEAIAYHIKNNIKDLLKKKNCYRIKFNEITKNAIITAINNPLDIDINLVKAQETRRFLDRIVGFKLSPLLWNKFNDKYLSVGRVQSVALLLCIEQLNLIKNEVTDTLVLARNKFPGSSINLDALCKRYRIDNSKRTKHTALIDCNLLAKVYINLLDQKEPTLNFQAKNLNDKISKNETTSYFKKIIKPTDNEIKLHNNYLKKDLKKNFF